MNSDDLVVPLQEILKAKQRELDDKEWEGHAPEALQALILEVKNLKWLDEQGDVWYPLF